MPYTYYISALIFTVIGIVFWMYPPKKINEFYGYRFYHPVLMRWLTRDPIEEDGGLNLYGFCRNSSICFSDTLGKTIMLTMDSNPNRKDVIKYKEFHAKASMHNSSFDSNNRNQGGQYAKYPFDTSTFKWE